MADLPSDRVKVSRVLAMVGIDYSDSFFIKLLLSSDATRLTLSDRGPPNLSWHGQQEGKEKIENFIASEGIVWYVNPPATTHFNDLWEEGIKSPKSQLKRIIVNTKQAYKELVTLSHAISEVPSYQEDFDTLRMDLNHATINRSNTGQRRPKTGRDTGSYTRWNHAYGSVHRGTDPQNRFQSRGNHGHPHQSRMMRFSGRQQFNNQVPDSPEAHLKRLFNPAMVVEDTVPRQTTSEGIVWYVNPPATTHFNDLWEEGIKSPKSQLKRVIVNAKQAYKELVTLDRVVVYSASTPQVWGSINGLRKVDSAFHPRYIGSINEYQACFGSKTLKVSLQTDHQIRTSVHAPQRPMVTCIRMGTVVPRPHGMLCF
ncbi:uncharacterized protein TNCV_2201261 [Trichonephila clavipes]|uniref:Uncharacterized protein n=1 Tax=Trichonephila clavipes TaxID=2585209 RepID=A0A8X6VKH2_TRICX|nr:uncharacterized protein TNCV_2201261 [Trichonephila clavipes]